MRGKSIAASFLAAGIGLLLVTLLLEILLLHSLAVILVSVIAPASALLMSAVGLALYGRQGLVRGDHLHILNLSISLGLVAFLISELTAATMSLHIDNEILHFIVDLIQLIGILLWAVGTVGYLLTSREVLGYMNPRTMWAALVVPSVAYGGLVLFVISGQNPTRDPIEIVTKTPVALGLSMVVLTMILLVWVFKSGRLFVPMALGLAGMLLALMRSALWVFSFFSGEPLAGLMGAESYLFLGASLVTASKL